MASLFFTVFRFGFAVIFVGLHCALMAGLILEWGRDKKALRRALAGAGGLGNDGRILADSPVSVIIPFRNEARRMEGLLRSLGEQDYSGAEYIFIDDRSTDGGAALLRSFAENRKGVRIITLRENPGPNHKQYALSRGIAVSSGRFLLFTDADCEVPRGWIRAMAARMNDGRTGITIGPVFKRWEGGGNAGKMRGFFRLYQCFDHAVRYMYLAASTGLGAAGGGFGNNLILRRSALDAIGGYDRVPPSPTEDAALISRIRSHSEYLVRSSCGADTRVMTGGEASWGAFVSQTLRWNNGGLFSPDGVTRFNFGFLMITISMGVLAVPTLPFFPSLWPLPAAVLLAMSGNTVAALLLAGSALPRAGAAYIVQLVFTPVYFTFLTILGFCGIKPRWKSGGEGEP